MTNSFDQRAKVAGRNSLCRAVPYTLGRAAAAVIFFAIACGTAPEASAQLDSMLRNLFQNAMPSAPTAPNYRPSYPPPPYPSYPPQSAAPSNPAYRAYSPPPAAAPASQDVGRVADLQRMLNELGYDAGPADGQPGARTVQAVRAFQRDHGQPSTGEMTEATVAAVRSVWYERSRAAGATPAAAPPTVAPPSAVRPGFDCARAADPTERQICASPQLARLDTAMSQAFGRAKADKSFVDQAKLVAEQQRWLQQRNGCGADPSCIERSMTERLAQLRSPQPTAGGDKLPATTAASDSQTTSQEPSSTDAGAPPARIDVDALLHPPTGVRALRLRIWEGMPLLRHPDSPDTEAFLDLVMLGIRPDLLEAKGPVFDQAAEYARTFLNPADPLNSQNWPRRNEFEKQDARAAFLRQYAEPLRHLAPRTPFRFAHATAASIGRYDSSRRGFDLIGMGSYILQQADFLQPGGIPLANGRVRLTPRYDFDMPSGFLAIEEADARALAERLSEQSHRGERRVQIITIFEATDAEPQTMTLGLQIERLEIWDDALTVRLRSLDVAPLRHQKLSSASPLQHLLHPPAALRPWELGSLDGRPAISADQVWQAGFQKWILAQDLVRLVAAGTIPGYLEDRNNLPSLKHLFSDQVIREVFLSGASVDNPGGWAGSDEFARERTRQVFYSRYAPALREFAPRPPFDVVYLQEAMLDPYASERRAFPVKQIDSADFQQRVNEAGLIPAPTFSLSGLFWPIDPANAEAVLKSLPNRRAKTAATYEIASLDPASKRLVIRLKALSLYTPDLKEKLYDLPIGNDPAPYLTAGAPERLKVAEPAVLDEVLLCLEFIAAGGDSVAPKIVNTCWDRVAKRDQAFYEGPDASVGLGPDDARRPFFPRGGADRTPAAMASFVRWAKTYAASLPAVTTPPSTGTTRQPDGSERVQVLAEARASQSERYAKFLSESRLQQDQVASPGNLYGDGENMPVLYILPNQRALYTVNLAKEALGRHPGSNAQSVSTFRVGAARIFRDDAGQNVLAIDLTPLSIKTFIGDDTLANRIFDDVPRLEGQNFNSPAPQPTTSSTAAPLPLDAALIDLLATKAVGEKLSPQSQIYLVLRRWRYENGEGSTPGGSFFVVGKRQPTPDEAAALAPKFVEWARQHGPDLPVRVTVRAKIQVANSQTTAPWRALPCLGMIYYQGGAYYEGFRPLSVSGLHDLSSRKSLAEKGTGSWSEQDEQKLLAAEALAGVVEASFVGGITGPCWMAPKYLDFPDPAAFVLRIPHALPTPSISAPTGKQQFDVSAALDITSLTLSQTPPSLLELLPEELAKTIPQSTARPLSGEFVAVDMNFVEVQYHDTNGKEAGRFGPDRGDSIDGVVQRFERKRTKLLTAQATPSGPYGPDLVGVQLGMSFEDAERAIRKHMKVGRVLEGRRAFDEAEKSGLIKPIDSGKLFISEGEDELIAIIDEPPAAPGRVLAAWRRISIPAGSADPAEIFAGIEKKYGKPGGNQAMRAGTIVSWYPLNGSACRSLYQSGQAYPLKEAWFEDGRPLANVPINSVQQKAARLPEPLFDPLSERSQHWTQCGPYITAQLGTEAMIGKPRDELDMTLTDIGPYLSAYAESRAKVQPTGDSAQRPAAGIKF